MPLSVIGAGLGRTGTMSLKLALEQLGVGPCYHMVELFGHPERPGHWLDAIAGRPMDWETVFDGYASTVDWPSVGFYKALADHYPDAKVILTVRDPDEWFELRPRPPSSARPSLRRRTRRGRRWSTSWSAEPSMAGSTTATT